MAKLHTWTVRQNNSGGWFSGPATVTVRAATADNALKAVRRQLRAAGTWTTWSCDCCGPRWSPPDSCDCHPD